MKTVIRKWGNSVSVRIPASVMQDAHLVLDQEVDIREEGGRGVIQPVRAVSYDLTSLLDGITEDNLYGDIPTGDAVGQEVW